MILTQKEFFMLLNIYNEQSAIPYYLLTRADNGVLFNKLITSKILEVCSISEQVICPNCGNGHWPSTSSPNMVICPLDNRKYRINDNETASYIVSQEGILNLFRSLLYISQRRSAADKKYEIQHSKQIFYIGQKHIMGASRSIYLYRHPQQSLGVLKQYFSDHPPLNSGVIFCSFQVNENIDVSGLRIIDLAKIMESNKEVKISDEKLEVIC